MYLDPQHCWLYLIIPGAGMNELVGAAIGGGGGGGVTAESVLQIQMQQQLYCTTTAKIPKHNSKDTGTTTQQQRYHNTTAKIPQLFQYFA